LYSESCTGYAVALFLYECDTDVFFSSSCSGYSAAVAQEQALEDAIYGTDDESYGYDDGYDETEYWFDEEWDEWLDPNDPCYENACESFTDADWYALDIEQFGQDQVNEWYGVDVEFSDEGYIDYGTSNEEEYWTNIDEGMDTYDQEQQEMFDEFTDADWYAYDVEEFGQEQVNEWWGDEVEFSEDGSFAYTEEEYYEEEQYTEEYYEEEYSEEVFLTDAEWYEVDREEFGQEQVDEWYGEDVSFDEEGYIPETYWEELYNEDVIVAQNLTDQEIYILEEEIGVEIFVEEEWVPSEENEIYEDVLEDFEVEALEEHEDEIFEEFDEEYDEEELFVEEDEAFEDLIDEEELDELINEEEEQQFFQQEQQQFFQEEQQQEIQQEEQKQQTTIVVAQEEQQQQEIQQAVSQDSSSSQATVAEIDFGGTQQEQQQVAEVVQEQLDDSSTGGSFDSNSYSSGSSSSGSSGFVASSSQQEQITQSTGNTFVVEQQEQSTGQVQTALQVTEVVDSGPVVSAFEVAEQQQETQDEQQELTFDDGSNFTVADQNFESSFDDALGTGQSIGQFLSNQQPDFAKFDVAPQTFDEQQVTTAVESLADRMGTQVAAQNLQVQLDTVQQGGGFDVDQTATVAFIGYSSGFSDYTGQEQLSDKDDWYISKTMYKGNDNKDNDLSFYMMAGRTQGKLQQMIDSQYNRE
jgi:hypothetical protein